MAELSRVKKYEELRNKLQFSVEDDAVASQELSRFEKRLNQIDADNFSFKEKDVKENSKPSHARNVYVSEVPTLSRREKKMDLETLTQDYRTEDSNEFVNEYIREVKQYNMDQGLASSENTSMNVLNQIRSQIGNKEAKVSSKPFPSDYQKPQNTMDDTKDTSDIPFFLDDARATKSIGNTEQLSIVEPKNHLFEDANSLSKADIMAEVQNLVNGNSKQNYEPMGTDTFQRELENDRTTQQQILNETSHMRAQMDDYEDNLNEINGKVYQANQLSNIILTVLLVVLIIIALIVVYLIIISRGV